MGLLITFVFHDILAQEQIVNNSEINDFNLNLERIHQRLDESSTQATIGTYIATIALFVSLALVIFGFQLSREGSLSRKAIIYCRVLVLSLIIPVLFLIVFAWYSLPDFLPHDYQIILSLFLIPCAAVILLMVTFSSGVNSKQDI
jgi:cytochrome bd-type quinol oxidase subunit 2